MPTDPGVDYHLGRATSLKRRPPAETSGFQQDFGSSPAYDAKRLCTSRCREDGGRVVRSTELATDALTNRTGQPLRSNQVTEAAATDAADTPSLWRKLKEVNPSLFERLENTEMHTLNDIPESVRSLWESSAGTVPHVLPSSNMYLSDARYGDRELWVLTSSGGELFASAISDAEAKSQVQMDVCLERGYLKQRMRLDRRSENFSPNFNGISTTKTISP